MIRIHKKLGISLKELCDRITYLSVNEKLTDAEISKIIIGVSPRTVYRIRNDMLKLPGFQPYQRQRRNVLLSFTFDDYQREVLDGLLLGDGSIARRKNPSPRYIHGTSKKETIIEISKILKIDYKIKTYDRDAHVQSNGVKISTTRSYLLTTKAYPQLKSFADRWYPNGKKIVPEDIVLTPTVCYWWYIGDGCLPKKLQSNGKIATNVLSLSTDGFSDDDRQLLIKLMKHYIGLLNIRTDKRGKLYIYSIDIPKFLNYIGPCKNPEYAYKWDYVVPRWYKKRN